MHENGFHFKMACQVNSRRWKELVTPYKLPIGTFYRCAMMGRLLSLLANQKRDLDLRFSRPIRIEYSEKSEKLTLRCIVTYLMRGVLTREICNPTRVGTLRMPAGTAARDPLCNVASGLRQGNVPFSHRLECVRFTVDHAVQAAGRALRRISKSESAPRDGVKSGQSSVAWLPSVGWLRHRAPVTRRQMLRGNGDPYRRHPCAARRCVSRLTPVIPRVGHGKSSPCGSSPPPVESQRLEMA